MEDKKVDFSNEESRKNFLITKFDDLFQGINNLYGKELMEELFHRMEKTIAIFHQDVENLIKEIKLTNSTGSTDQPIIGISDIPQTPAEPNPFAANEDNDWAKHLG